MAMKYRISPKHTEKSSFFSLPVLALVTSFAVVSCVPQDVPVPVPSPTPSPSPVPPSYSGFSGVISAQTVGATKVQLNWTPSSDPTVVGYNIYNTTSLFAPTLIRTVAAPASSVTLTGLANETYYTFRVRAADSQDNEDDNTKDVPAIPYAGITGAQVQSSSSAMITFNDGSNADQIQVFCSTDGGKTYSLYKGLTNVTLLQTLITGLTSGTTYTCRTALEISNFVDNNTVTTTFTPIGQATQMVFSTQPGSATAGTALIPQPVVTIMDANNNVVTAGPDASAVITLTIAAASPTIGTIRGTAAVAAVKGVATFSGLYLQEAGAKIITATKPDTSAQTYGSPPLTVNSNSFTISPGAVSATTSTIAATPTGPLVANGSAAYTVTMTLEDQYGNAISGVKPQFASSVSADTVTQPSTASGVTGTATGSLVSTVSGVRTLDITSPSGLTSVTTTATFTPGAATKVAFVQQPANSPAGVGEMSQLQVAIEDAQGNVVSTGASSTANVSVSIFTNPGGGTLSGTATVAAVNGVATFAGLGISHTGTGYKLVASSSPLAVAYSNAFNVTAGVPGKIVVTGPTTLVSGTCSAAVTVQLQDLGGNPANATANTPLTIAGLGAGGGVYTSASCSGTAVAGSITITSGSSSKTLYLKDNKAESIVITVSDPASVLTQGTLGVSITPSVIALAAPATAVAGKCTSGVTLTTEGADGTSGPVAVATQAQITGLSTNAGFYTDSACTANAVTSGQVTLAAGSSTTALYFLDKKAETMGLNASDPLGVMSTGSTTQNVNVVASNIGFTGPASVVSGHCSTAFTASLKDALGNSVTATSQVSVTISGISTTHGAFYSTPACTGAPLGTAAIIPQGSSQAQLYFIDYSAEAVSIKLTDPNNILANSPTLNIGVSPSALAIAAPSPATVKTSVCSSAFTVTTLDGSGNVTNAITPISVALSGATTGGAFYADSACATTAITTMSFATGVSTQIFYYMSSAPAATLTLTATDQAGVLSAGTATFAVTAAPGWIGTHSVQSNWFQTGVTPVAARLNGPQGVYSLHFDSGYQNLYVVDQNQHRVLKYNYQTQSYVGWIGEYWSGGGMGITGSNISPSINVSCINTTANGSQTPGWCTGGQSQANSNGANGNMYSPAGITDDGTWVYVTQWNSNIVTRYNAATGAYGGWIGQVSSTPSGPGTGLSNTCSTTTSGNATPGWCMGGATTYSCNIGTGAMCNPRAIAYDPTSGYLYVSNNGAVMRFVAATGAFYGWVGQVAGTAPTGPAPDVSNTCSTVANGYLTPGWCMGGSSTNVNPNGPTYPKSPVTNSINNGGGGVNQPTGLYVDSTNRYLYVVHADNGGTVTKYNLDTGAFQGTIINTNLVSAYEITYDGTFFYLADSYRVVKMDTSGNIWSWFGKVSNNLSMSGNTGCSTLVPNADTPGWCSGGSSKAGMDEQALQQTVAIAYDGNGYILTGEGSYDPAIKKWSTATGVYQGTLSKISNSPQAWTNDTSSFAEFYGFDDYSMYSPEGVYNDGTNLYLAEGNAGRVKKVSLATGATLGWIGGITTVPTGGVSGCTAATAMSLSPGWCLGALFQPNYMWNNMIPQSASGLMNYPEGLASDGTYLYVVDEGWHRVEKFNLSTGAYVGWIGGINATPTGGATGCAGAASGTFTPGWCTGGTPSSGSGNGFMNNPSGIVYTGGNLYVIDYYNNRVNSYNASTGAFNGWIGRVNVTPTSGCTTTTKSGYTYSGTGWCLGGNAQASITGADPGGGFSFGQNCWNVVRGGITTDGTYLYIENTCNSRIDKFSLNGVYQASLRQRPDQYTNTWTSNPTTWGWEGSAMVGLWTDSTNLYGAGGYNNDIVKISLATGSVTGWKGAITPGNAPSAPSDCVGATGTTPDWCQGGGSTQGYTLGGFTGGNYWITGDSNYVYISDTNANRVTRVPK